MDSGHTAIVKELLARKAAVDAPAGFNGTAAGAASAGGQLPALKLLVQTRDPSAFNRGSVQMFVEVWGNASLLFSLKENPTQTNKQIKITNNNERVRRSKPKLR